MDSWTAFRRLLTFDWGRRPPEELAAWLGMPLEQLGAITPRYSSFAIPKRSGGTRTIDAPADDLKEVQLRILHRVLRGLRAHPAAHGFECGRSIVTNARPHVGKAVVLNLDLRDFFGDTAAHRVGRFLRRAGWSRLAARLLQKLTTHEGGLPQGAPTSPRLSNLVNYQMDCRLQGLATALGADYTRYADDITFSIAEDDRERLAAALHGISTIVGDFEYELHPDKRSVRRRHQRQEVTGLVVNDAISLPRETRRWLRAVEHRMRTTGTSSLNEEELQGWLAYVSMVHRQGRDASLT